MYIIYSFIFIIYYHDIQQNFFIIISLFIKNLNDMNHHLNLNCL